MGMPGTVVVPEDVFVALLRSVMAGLWNMGFRKMILLNGHGQEYVIPVAIHQFAKRYQLPMIIINLNWYHAIPEHFRKKPEGGNYETDFIHADEVETSWALALLPEMVQMEDAVDTVPEGFLPEGHVDKAGNLLRRPIAWYGHAGCGPIEIYQYPDGVVGRATLAEASKAKDGVEALLDYIVSLHDDILSRFPSGKLPPVEKFTQRSEDEVKQVLKGPLDGGKSIYTLAYPP
jgi:creatinine amidohydrolase